MSDETDNHKSQVNLERNGNVSEEINGNPIGISTTTEPPITVDSDNKTDGKDKKDWVKFDDDESNKNKIQVRVLCVCILCGRV